MKFGDIPASGGSASYSFGVNPMYIQEWSITDGQYGKQLEIVFCPNPNAEKPRMFKSWTPLRGAFKSDQGYMFMSKISQYRGILDNYLGEELATEKFNAIKVALANVEFDNEDREQVQNLEEKIIKAIFKIVGEKLSEPINVVLHFKGEYLNVPNYKENDYNLPFGLNPIMGKSLNSEKGQSAPRAAEASMVEPSNGAMDISLPTSAKDPFDEIPF
jgi:hypothetical protein